MSAIIDALARRSSDTLARLPEIRLALTHARERVQTAALEQALLVAALDQALLVIELAEHLRGAMAAQDEREQLAGERCGVSAKEAGCDWPDEVADVVIGLRERIVSGATCLCGDSIPPQTGGACGTCHSRVKNERDKLAAILSLMQAALRDVGLDVCARAIGFERLYADAIKDANLAHTRACVTTCGCGDEIMPGTGALCGNCGAARTVL